MTPNLFTQPAPVPRPLHNGTPTSIAAAASLAPDDANAKRRMVYNAVRLSSDGLTREQVAAATGMKEASVCGRANELVKAGRLKEEGTRETSTGRPAAILWAVTSGAAA